MKDRLLIVSDRLPVDVANRSGELRYQRSVGGLATGLASFSQGLECLWLGWPGIARERLSGPEQREMAKYLKSQDCCPVMLSAHGVRDCYQGFSNKTIWPLFHYFPLPTTYEDRHWEAFVRVNEAFSDVVAQQARPGDRIWIHDYPLMLLPAFVRKKCPGVSIGFFLHIPFPSFELFRLLPWREEILHGVMGADLVGFHTYDYVRHFVSSVSRILGAEHTLGSLALGDRSVQVDAFPMGIDYARFAEAAQTPEVRNKVAAFRMGVEERKIILSVDQLDYTQGIVERIEAFDWFLTQYPQYKEAITLIQVAVPSGSHADDDAELRAHVENLVGRVNGAHGTLGWVPISYLHRSLSFAELVALYSTAQIALVTPLRDGMNLVAKEFIACRANGQGVLILSEMAGSASELGEALIVNANSKAATVAALKQALEMPAQEQIERNGAMQERLRRYTVTRWANDFMQGLSEARHKQERLQARMLSDKARDALIQDFCRSDLRLLLLDYDGTLVDFVDKPDRAAPDPLLTDLLGAVTADIRNQAVIISGRDRHTLGQWLGHLPLDLIAEHGAWTREFKGAWQAVDAVQAEWKDTIRPILELYTDRTPGSRIEEKDFSLVWHFRRADSDLAYMRTQELRNAILSLAANQDIGVFEGSRILEIRHLSVSKARATELWLNKKNWDFILAAGADHTDEDMFSVIPEHAYSLKVGRGPSKARFNIDSVTNLRELLGRMCRAAPAKIEQLRRPRPKRRRSHSTLR